MQNVAKSAEAGNTGAGGETRMVGRELASTKAPLPGGTLDARCGEGVDNME